MIKSAVMLTLLATALRALTAKAQLGEPTARTGVQTSRSPDHGASVSSVALGSQAD